MLDANYPLPTPSAVGYNGISGGGLRGAVMSHLSQEGHLNNAVTFGGIMRHLEEPHYPKSL